MSESNATTPLAPAESANGPGYGPIKSPRGQTQRVHPSQLRDRTVTDEIRGAIDAWIEKANAGPALQRLAHVRKQVEWEAAGSATLSP